MQKTVALLEIGGSHDECILSQLIGLKQQNVKIIFCSTKAMFEKNSFFSNYIDEFYEITFPKTMIGDFLVMIRLNKWLKQQKVDVLIANTAQGGHVRNLCLTSSSKIKFIGIIHTIKMLEKSFTQSLISRKIKHYFVLNDTLKSFISPNSPIRVDSFYPLSFPNYSSRIDKPNDQIWIAIIGGVENRRKDLSGFIEMASQTSENIHFYFLGKSNHQSENTIEFKKQLSEYKLEKRVHLFDDFLTQETFDNYLNQINGIFPLVHPNTSSAEEYFTRQIPGAINIAFGYKIPMMIHSHYQNWEDFNKGVVFYDLNNFKQQFDRFINQQIELKNQLIDNPKFKTEFQNQLFANSVLNY